MLDDIVADRDTSVVLCCGAGGVGKTSVSAALALRAAESGRRVAVMTIDPAKRLAMALGVGELGNEPQAVAGVDTSRGGRLDAMMLDMKRTFDDAIRAHTSPERAAALLTNPYYDTISRSFSGTQEYMAMEKLGELVAAGADRWDLVVVDTPPSVSALDFLDAPERLGRLLHGRVLRTLLAPARGPLRLLGASMGAATQVLSTLLGAAALADLQAFLVAFDSVTGGFDERARRTRAVLSAPSTSCLVVATPQPGPLTEADRLAARLADGSIRLRGMVVNRMTPVPAAVGDAATTPAGRWAQAHLREQRERARAERDLVAAHGRGLPRVLVPLLGSEIDDLDGLRRLADLA